MTTAELLKTPEDLKGSAGAEAKLGFKAHPHMLRHALGFALASKGMTPAPFRAYLGHKKLTVRIRSCRSPVSRTSGGLRKKEAARGLLIWKPVCGLYVIRAAMVFTSSLFLRLPQLARHDLH